MNSAFSPDYKSVIVAEAELREAPTSELTLLQHEVLTFVCAFRETHQMPPTRVEIARHFNWASANTAETHLRAIERKGFIRIVPGQARGIFDLETA